MKVTLVINLKICVGVWGVFFSPKVKEEAWLLIEGNSLNIAFFVNVKRGATFRRWAGDDEN